MNLTVENILHKFEYLDSIKIRDIATGAVARIETINTENNNVVIRDLVGTKEMPIECVNGIYEECNELDDMKEEYKKCHYNLVPHEPLVPLCYVFEDFYTEQEHSVTFAVPLSWLIGLLDKETGKRYWDEYKVFEWLDNEYTSDDSCWVWEQAIEEDKVALFEINY